LFAHSVHCVAYIVYRNFQFSALLRALDASFFAARGRLTSRLRRRRHIFCWVWFCAAASRVACGASCLASLGVCVCV
jgi:hypothetical protein